MTKQSLPKAASRTANHCDALLSRRETRVELGPEFERFGERLAGALRSCVATVSADPEARISSLGVQEIPGEQFGDHCAPLVAASRHRFGTAGHTLYLALDGRAILEHLDRTFGGTGEVDGTLPEKLPHTARLLAARLEQQVLAAVTNELGGLEFSADDTAFAGSVVPAGAGAELSALTLKVETTGGREWQIVLAVETAALPSLLPKRASAPSTAASRRKPGIGDAPFADLPLSVGARLVDMAMPLHRLASIEPGAVLPIMVARDVPLQVGEIAIARGTVGELDDRVALQITQTFTGKETQ